MQNVSFDNISQVIHVIYIFIFVAYLIVTATIEIFLVPRLNFNLYLNISGYIFIRSMEYKVTSNQTGDVEFNKLGIMSLPGNIIVGKDDQSVYIKLPGNHMAYRIIVPRFRKYYIEEKNMMDDKPTKRRVKITDVYTYINDLVNTTYEVT